MVYKWINTIVGRRKGFYAGVVFQQKTTEPIDIQGQQGPNALKIGLFLPRLPSIKRGSHGQRSSTGFGRQQGAARRPGFAVSVVALLRTG